MNALSAASNYLKIFLVLIILQNVVKATSFIKLTGVHCEVLDKSFGEFRKCELKAISRSKTVASVTFKFLRPISDCVISAQLMRKASDWRPFLYDLKFNACDFLLRPKKYIIPNIVWQYFRPYTNVNHSCPYKSGEELRLMSFEMDSNDFLKRFPIENGEYAILTKWYYKNVPRIALNGYVSYMDYNNKN